MPSTTDAWIEKVDSLAWMEILHAPEPSLKILDYWPTTAITEWRAKRQEPAPTRFDKRLLEIQYQRRVELSQRHATPRTTSTKLLQLLRSTGFYPWVWSIHGAPQYLDVFCAEAKQGEEEGFTATLEELRSSLLRAIGVAHVGVHRLQILLLRIRVLEHRFRNITDATVVMDLHAPLSADFTFLTDLVGLRPLSLAKVLACGCFLLYREIAPIDIRCETERSRTMAEWSNILQWKGEECVAAGLANEVQALAKCLWMVGDHHSSRALEASYEHITSNKYWKRCGAEARTGGLLYSFRDCKHRVEAYKGLRAVPDLIREETLKKEHDFLVSIMLNTTQWGDVQQPSLASFRASSPAPNTSDRENWSAQGSGSSPASESEDLPRTVKHTKSLRKLGRLFKKTSSTNED